MIDTMFFLLVFFILASLNIVDLRGINIELPTSVLSKSSVKDPKEVRLEVRLDKDGTKFLNDSQTPIKPEESMESTLRTEINRQLGHAPSAVELTVMTVVISPSEDTYHKHVISVIDDSRTVKIGKFAIR